MKRMRQGPRLLTFAFAFLLTQTVNASDPISLNIVGYANIQFFPGDNLIANQFVQGGNTLNTVLVNGTAAGSTFTMWDPLANALLTPSVFDGSSWSINYVFSLGSGGVLNSPVMATNTFLGNVILYTNIVGNNSDIPLSGIGWHPNYANGLYLLSIPVALVATGDNLFRYVTDRSPNDGNWVKTLDPATQTYHTTTYHTGSGWDNGDPALNIGQSGWFSLDPVTVPEPAATVIALMAFGLAAKRRGFFK